MEICAKWKVSELALFGSALRDDFRPESNVDVLVRFDPGADWGLSEFMQIEEELAAALLNVLLRAQDVQEFVAWSPSLPRGRYGDSWLTRSHPQARHLC